MPSATTTYGFIGLGQMGHGMAKNIRSRIPPSCVLLIYDINQKVVQQFVENFGEKENVIAATSPKEVASRAVCGPRPLSTLHQTI
jgi:3-hydroxyisobutyrate dehydrogenase-like beta-hydroxyacid dehydrogenase